MRATRSAPASFPKAMGPWRWRLAAPLGGLLVWLACCGSALALGTVAVEGRSPAAAAAVSGPALVLGHLRPAGAADAAGASANAATAAGAAGPASGHGRLGWRLLALGVGGAAGWLLVRLARSAGGRPRVGDED